MHESQCTQWDHPESQRTRCQADGIGLRKSTAFRFRNGSAAYRGLRLKAELRNQGRWRRTVGPVARETGGSGRRSATREAGTLEKLPPCRLCSRSAWITRSPTAESWRCVPTTRSLGAAVNRPAPAKSCRQSQSSRGSFVGSNGEDPTGCPETRAFRERSLATSGCAASITNASPAMRRRSRCARTCQCAGPHSGEPSGGLKTGGGRGAVPSMTPR